MTKNALQPNTLRILETASRHPSGISALAVSDLTGLEIEEVARRMKQLRTQGRLKNTAKIGHPAIWKCTQKGLGIETDKPTTKMQQPKNGPGYTATKDPRFYAASSDRITNGTKRDVYTGCELKPYTGRPDANDHMNFGSVVNGIEVPYTPPRPVCVGVAGPVPLSTGQVRYAK